MVDLFNMVIVHRFLYVYQRLTFTTHASQDEALKLIRSGITEASWEIVNFGPE